MEGTAWRAGGEFLILFGLYQEHWKKTRNCVSARENSTRENNWRNACKS